MTHHGLVLGKFYPPHLGHLHLVERAAAACERVTVLVLAASWEQIPLAVREGWMRELCARWPHVTVVGGRDDVPVDYDDPAIWEAHMRAFQAAIAHRPPVDAVFTSEAYGPELAHRFGGAAHVLVDLDRVACPVSGTAARTAPQEVWPWLPAPVRGFLARRVVVVGAESTGTTTLARALQAALVARGGVWAATRWVPEVGRAYTLEKLAHGTRLADLAWDTADFVDIAERQTADEEALAREGSPVLVCDTDALATCIWHERYMGCASPAVEAVARRTHHDLYLLTDHVGVPFEQDGLRDGEHLRAWMTGRFREVLAGLPVVELQGPPDVRLAHALVAVDALLATPPDLTARSRKLQATPSDN